MGETGTAALELDEHSGDVILRFGGNEYRAHPPTLGQMRQLEQYAEQTDRAEQERQAAADTSLLVLSPEAIAEKREELFARAQNPDEDMAQVVAEMVDWIREREAERAIRPTGGISSDNAEQLVGWWHLLFELTGEPKLPNPDDCPMWLGSLSLISQTLVHFMLFPIRGLGSSSPNPGPPPPAV